MSLEREPRGRADYEDRVEARRERLEGAAEKARAAGEAAMERGRAMANAIPLGQPIMIGHHSEKRDRSFRARAQASMRRGVDALARASELASAASKSSGWRWSPTEGAFLRMLNDAGIYAAKRAAALLAAEVSP